MMYIINQLINETNVQYFMLRQSQKIVCDNRSFGVFIA